MKFLLTALNAKFIHTNPALYSLKAYASQYGLKEHVKIAEYTINNSREEILRGIYSQMPDAIAFSCYIWNIAEVLSLVREFHKILPYVPVWLGGPEVSFRAEELVASYPEVTGIMTGEGEETFTELLQYYTGQGKERGPERIEDIRGIVFSQKGKVIRTKERELTNLSKLPFLYEDLSEFAHKIIYYESSRGCPFRCSYCLSSIDKKVRLRDMDIVKRELQFFLDHKVVQVKFVDRTFNCNRSHAMEIWKYIKEHDNGITNFHFEIAADLLGEEELTLLSSFRPGAVQMEIGVQTLNPETLGEIRRTMDADKLEKTVERLRLGRNIHIHLDLIAGLPFEDYASFRNSFNGVYRMKPEQLQLGFLKVLSGSYMAEKCEDYGLLYTDYPPYEVLQTVWLSYRDVCRLKQIEEMVELYYNSCQFTMTLPYLERFFESPFAMFERLASFYDRKGCFFNTPSRIYRYEVLREFVEEETDGDDGLFRELLTADVYLRENMKSRPAFAKDLTPYKERISGFFRQEVKRRDEGKHLLPAYEEYDSRTLSRLLHLEPFSYDIFGENPSYKRLEKEKMILFDYKDRNPLTHEAAVMILDGAV